MTAELPASGQEDVDVAVEAAAAALDGWAALPGASRGAILFAAADLIEERREQIAHDITTDMGKALLESQGEVARAAAILRFFSGEPWRPTGEMYEQTATGRAVYTIRRPLGVVGLITPWNFPIAIPAWKLAPALIYGNTVVLKVAQDAPSGGLHLAHCLAEAGLPPGVLNVIIGTGSEAGTALVAHPRVRAISFTGSVEVGQHVREGAARLGKRVQLELGGHSPLIIMADADLDAAVEAAFSGAFLSSGQKCTATRRIFVQAPVYEAFRERFLARIIDAKVGDPMDPETEIGPIVNERQMEGVLEAVGLAKRQGAKILIGGNRADGEGYVLEPTVFEDAPEDSIPANDEIFGPVTSLYPFATLSEALSRANSVEYGLSASIFTRDIAAVRRFVTEAEAGVLHVNQQTVGSDVHVPFGGIKASGYGPHEQGRAAREFYTDVITVYEEV